MIPLLFIALVLGVGLTAYEFSPKAHTWADAHAQAIRDAIAAHHKADAKLDAAQAAVDVHAAAQTSAPGASSPVNIVDLLQHAWDNLKAATQANAAAAAHTTTALETAKTDPQKAVATQSATAVDARQQRIATALAKLGAGQCDARSYAGVTAKIKDALLAKLHGEGMTVTGDDPWDVDTHQHDVKLRAVWDPAAQVLKLIVTAGADGILGNIVCAAVWAKIDPIMMEILKK